MSGRVQSHPEGPVLAKARALFVIPRVAQGSKALVEKVATNMLKEAHPD